MSRVSGTLKQIWKSSNVYDDEKFLEVVIKVGAWDYGKMSFFVFVFVLIGLEGSFIHIYIGRVLLTDVLGV